MSKAVEKFLFTLASPNSIEFSFLSMFLSIFLIDFLVIHFDFLGFVVCDIKSAIVNKPKVGLFRCDFMGVFLLLAGGETEIFDCNSVIIIALFIIGLVAVIIGVVVLVLIVVSIVLIALSVVGVVVVVVLIALIASIVLISIFLISDSDMIIGDCIVVEVEVAIEVVGIEVEEGTEEEEVEEEVVGIEVEEEIEEEEVEEEEEVVVGTEEEVGIEVVGIEVEEEEEGVEEEVEVEAEVEEGIEEEEEEEVGIEVEEVGIEVEVEIGSRFNNKSEGLVGQSEGEDDDVISHMTVCDTVIGTLPITVFISALLPGSCTSNFLFEDNCLVSMMNTIVPIPLIISDLTLTVNSINVYEE